MTVGPFSTPRSRLVLLFGIIVVIVGTVVGITLLALYQSALETERLRLIAVAQSESRLMAIMHQHELETGATPTAALDNLIALLVRTYEGWHVVLGETGEMALARRDGESIRFLFRNFRSMASEPLLIIPWGNEHLAHPMRLALTGNSGGGVGFDYRGVPVLAAYTFIAPLRLGLVVKIDLAELQAPWQQAILPALGASLLLALLGSLLFSRFSEAILLQLRTSEQNLAITLDAIGDGVIVTDARGCITRMNPVAETLTGWSLAEAITRPMTAIFPLVHAQTGESLVDPVTKVIQSGVGVSLANHTCLITRLGTERQIADSGAPIRDHRGDLLGVVMVFRDVTEAYGIRQALKSSEQRLRKVVENMPFLLAAYDERGTLVAWNRECARVSGYATEEIVGNPEAMQHLYPDDTYRAAILEEWQQLHGEQERGEWTLTARDGTPRTVIWANMTRRCEINGWAGWGVGVEVTELRRLEARYRDLFENISSGVAVYQLPEDGSRCTFLAFNQAAEQIEQIDRSQVLGREITEVFPGVEAFGLLEVFRRVRRTGVMERYPVSLYQDDRIVGWRDNCVYRLPTGEVVAVYDDVTELKRTEMALVQSERRFRSVFTSLLDGLLLCAVTAAPEGQGTAYWVLGINPALERLSGLPADQWVGQLLPVESANSDPNAIWLQILAESRTIGQPVTREIFLATWNRHLQVVAYAIDHDRYAVLFRDLTQQRLQESRLRQAYKMEAIGTLAGGIAHDFNNILGIILGFTELIARQLPEGSQPHQDVQEVYRAGLRARDLVSQLLTFSRMKDRQRRPTLLLPMLKEVVKFMRAVLPANVTIVTHFHHEQALVLADPTEIHQVLINLCTNGSQAMAVQGGQLTLTLEECTLDIGALLPPGPYAKLSVDDTGHGITPEILPRIFDPFFTSKKVGEGTGLGLSVVHGIVEEIGGAVEVFSQPGVGSRFHVYLPTIESPPLEAGQGEEKTWRTPIGLRVLVVDDEPALAEVTSQQLRRLGCRVHAVTDPEQALDHLRRDPSGYDLVLTDQTMPGSTGVALLPRLRALNPDLPVVLVSGYQWRVSHQELLDLGFHAFLIKPVLAADLARLLEGIRPQIPSVE